MIQALVKIIATSDKDGKYFVNTYCYCFIAQTNNDKCFGKNTEFLSFSARLWLADPFCMHWQQMVDFSKLILIHRIPSKTTAWRRWHNMAGTIQFCGEEVRCHRKTIGWQIHQSLVSDLTRLQLLSCGGGTHLWLRHIHLLYYSLHSLINSAAWWSGAGSRE